MRHIRGAGWLLLGTGVLSASAIVAAGTLRAKGAVEFGRWGAWATVTSLAVGAVGVALPLWEKVAGSTDCQETNVSDAENELAAVVLEQAQVARSRLLGTDEAGDQAANVRFVKGTGRFREVGGASQGDLASALKYYQSLSPRRLVVLGDPGAGKTVLAMELLIRLLEQRQHDGRTPVPILVSAAACDTSRPWEEWLADHLAQRFSMDAQVAARLVRERRVLPVVDGLDEMDPAHESKRARAVVAGLNSFMRCLERSAVVVTCRRTEYQALGSGVDRATHIELVPLTGCEAAAYLSAQLRGKGEEQAWEPVLACLRTDPGGLLAAQLATPWRLTLALAVFRDDGDPAELLPGSVPDPPGSAADRYAERVDALLLGRYVPAKVRLHSREGGYTPQQVQRWLTALADGLGWQARHNGSATDIQLDQWWRPVGQWVTRLAHMTIVAVTALPWFAVAAVRHQPGPAVVGSTIVPFVAFAALAPVPHRLKVRQLTTRRGLLRFLLRFAVIIVGGLTLGLAGRLAAGLAAGLALVLALGLTGWLALGTEDSSPQAVGPRDVIEADANFGLAAGLAFGLGGGLAGGLGGGLAGWLAARLGIGFAGGLGGGLSLGLAFGLTFGLAFELAFGAGTSARYHLSVVIGAVRGSGPMGFGAFLDWGHQAGLLRLSGIAYQFRHRQLQDSLTSRRRPSGYRLSRVRSSSVRNSG